MKFKYFAVKTDSGYALFTDAKDGVTPLYMEFKTFEELELICKHTVKRLTFIFKE